MSISNQTNKTYGSGNGVTTVFSFNFKIFDVSEIYAYLINNTTGVVTGPLVYTTDYTVSINAITEGGTVTFVVAPPTGYTWFIKRLVPYTQGAIIPSEGTLPGPQIENQLDLMTMMVIQIGEQVSRALVVAPTFTGTTPALPSPVDGYAIGWLGTDGTMQNILVDSAAIAVAVAAAAASASAAGTSQTAAAASASTASAQATTAAAQAVLAAASAAAAAASAATFVPLKVKIINTTRDVSTASGTQTISGVGFTPKGCLAIMCVPAIVGGTSIGYFDGSTNFVLRVRTTAGTFSGSTANLLDAVVGGDEYQGTIVFNSDGGVITWVKTGTPTGTADIGLIFWA